MVDNIVGLVRRGLQSVRFAAARLVTRQSEKAVLFMSFGGRSISDSPKEIAREMMSNPQFDDWEFIWALTGPAFAKHGGMRGNDGSWELSEFGDITSSRIQIVLYEGGDFYRALAKAKYWVTNFRTPEGVHPGKRKTYIQTWHGAPIKRLGADITVEKAYPTKKRAALIDWYKREAAKWSILVSQSDYVTEKLWSAFAIAELPTQPKVLTEGTPRNVPLCAVTESTRNSLRDRLGIPEGKSVALYAPTFRDNQHTSKFGHTHSLALDLRELRRELGDEWVFLLRVHYLVNNSIDVSLFTGFAIDVGDYEEINDLYIASDVLVSDYSSSIVDYTVTGKPIIIYAYDLDEYEQAMRGFYIESAQFPGPIVKSQAKLVTALRSIEDVDRQWSSRRAEFASSMAPNDDEDTARRVVAALFPNH
jgi:CDP-glycerol glycerophosphotransferase